MALDWASDHFVRLYTRETDDDLLLSWEALAVWHMFLKKCDKSGLLETRRGVRGLAALLRIPIEVVERVLQELIEDGRMRSIPSVGFRAPNYTDANYTARSGGARQADARIRAKVTGPHGAGSEREDDSHGASGEEGEDGLHGAGVAQDTPDASHDVTESNAESRRVTPRAQIRSDQIRSGHSARARGGGSRFSISAEWQPRDRERQLAVEMGLDADAEAREFLAYWLGDGRAKKDWDQIFANRLLSQAKRRRPVVDDSREVRDL